MINYTRNLLVVIIVLFYSSCATKKQNTFNFGGGRGYDKEELLENGLKEKLVLQGFELEQLDTLEMAVEESRPENLDSKSVFKKESKVLDKKLAVVKFKPQKFLQREEGLESPTKIGENAIVIYLMLIFGVGAMWTGSLAFLIVFLGLPVLLLIYRLFIREKLLLNRSKKLELRAARRTKIWQEMSSGERLGRFIKRVLWVFWLSTIILTYGLHLLFYLILYPNGLKRFRSERTIRREKRRKYRESKR
jgi:hypothetical protein